MDEDRVFLELLEDAWEEQDNSDAAYELRREYGLQRINKLEFADGYERLRSLAESVAVGRLEDPEYHTHQDDEPPETDGVDS